MQTRDNATYTLRHIGLAGWTLFVPWFLFVVAMAFLHPDPYAQAWRLVLELAFLGIAVNIADGTSIGCSPVYMAIQCGLQDMILVLVAYPWIVRGYETARHIPVVGRFLRGVHVSAQLHRSYIEPLGAIGLWVFTFFPFWSTGALVGGALGFLIGMRTRIVLPIVLSAHAASVLSMIWLFDWMGDVAAVLGSGAVRFLPWAVIIVLAVVYWVMQRWLGGIKKKGSPQEDCPDIPK